MWPPLHAIRCQPHAHHPHLNCNRLPPNCRVPLQPDNVLLKLDKLEKSGVCAKITVSYLT